MPTSPFTHSGVLPASAAQALEEAVKRISPRWPVHSPVVPAPSQLLRALPLIFSSPQMTSLSSVKGALCCSLRHYSGLHIICITGLPWFPQSLDSRSLLPLKLPQCAISPSQKRCDSRRGGKKFPKTMLGRLWFKTTTNKQNKKQKHKQNRTKQRIQFLF